MSLCVGDSFETYSELQTCIDEFEHANYWELVHRDSRTLTGAKTHAPKVVAKAKPELKYYSINLVCSFGGKKYKGEGSGARPRQR